MRSPSRNDGFSGRATAALLLIATAPLAAVVALLVRLDVGRPVLFTQARSGLHGVVFELRKFRTMRDLRDRDGVPLEDADRITTLGRWLRRTRIDEWPQLLAIARGDLGWIGPRPLLPETVAGFGELGRLRARVRPGLTGWAQVNGNTRLGNRSKLALDLWYVKHRSPALDRRILLRTVATLAYGERLDARRINEAMDFTRRLVASDPPGTS